MAGVTLFNKCRKATFDHLNGKGPFVDPALKATSETYRAEQLEAWGYTKGQETEGGEWCRKDGPDAEKYLPEVIHSRGWSWAPDDYADPPDGIPFLCHDESMAWSLPHPSRFPSHTSPKCVTWMTGPNGHMDLYSNGDCVYTSDFGEASVPVQYDPVLHAGFPGDGFPTGL